MLKNRTGQTVVGCDSGILPKLKSATHSHTAYR
ncbi:hypothetical protein MNBD_GAMMA18-491, partial [hydrothermal vent metagenome]